MLYQSGSQSGTKFGYEKCAIHKDKVKEVRGGGRTRARIHTPFFLFVSIVIVEGGLVGAEDVFQTI